MLRKQNRFVHFFRCQRAHKPAAAKNLQESLVRNLIQFLDGLPLHIDLAGRSQNMNEPRTPEILRNEFSNQANLSQKIGKFPGNFRLGRLHSGDKSA